MNHRDLWFVGLLALAYLYLDAVAPSEPRAADPQELEDGAVATRRAVAAQGGFHEGVTDMADPFFPDACPRDLSHPVSLRSDGAKWCFACDEGFYPALS